MNTNNIFFSNEDKIQIIEFYLHMQRASDIMQLYDEEVSLAILESAKAILDRYDVKKEQIVPLTNGELVNIEQIDEMNNIKNDILKSDEFSC